MSTSHTLTRIVLPLILFVGILGAVAWLRQNLPTPSKVSKTEKDTGNETKAPRTEEATLPDSKDSGTEPDTGSSSPLTPTADDSTLLKFDSITAVWYKDDLRYFKEFEQNQPGFYDFHFENVADKELELGVQSNCDCSRSKIALLPGTSKTATDYPNLDWKTMNPVGARREDSEDQISVPPAAHGLIRFSWNNNTEPKNEPTFKVQKPILWFQPKGRPGEREQQRLECRMAIVAPVMFMPANLLENPTAAPLAFPPAKQIVGEVRDSVTAKFICWSVTRSELKLDPDLKGRDPRFVQKIEPLSPSARAEFEKKLKAMTKAMKPARESYHVQSASYLYVTVHLEKGGKQLDQGYNLYVSKLLLDGMEFSGPTVAYFVRGDLQVGKEGDEGKVNLRSFPAGIGTIQVVPILADPKVQLKLLDNWSPSTLEVRLTRDDAESTRDQAKWNLEVVVPPNTCFAPLDGIDKNGEISLQISETRQIRIPVVGNPTQSLTDFQKKTK